MAIHSAAFAGPVISACANVATNWDDRWRRKLKRMRFVTCLGTTAIINRYFRQVTKLMTEEQTTARSEAIRSLREVGAMLGISYKTVEEAEHRALMKLFKGMMDDPEVQAAYRDTLTERPKTLYGLGRQRYASDAGE